MDVSYDGNVIMICEEDRKKTTMWHFSFAQHVSDELDCCIRDLFIFNDTTYTYIDMICWERCSGTLRTTSSRLIFSDRINFVTKTQALNAALCIRHPLSHCHSFDDRIVHVIRIFYNYSWYATNMMLGMVCLVVASSNSVDHVLRQQNTAPRYSLNFKALGIRIAWFHPAFSSFLHSLCQYNLSLFSKSSWKNVLNLILPNILLKWLVN